MKEYHKIQTVFKRDPQTKFKTLIDGEYSLPCFEYLKDNEWTFTEKVDGTNIRVMLNNQVGEPLDGMPGSLPDKWVMNFGGKTDNAQIPSALGNRLREMFDLNRMREQFPEGVCLYGEGYGPKIQKGGGNYRSDQDFVLFDVKVGDWWLERSSVVDVATALGMDVVPIIGFGTIDDMKSMCRDGIKSQWGDFQAEGIVARPSVELKTRSGERIITKLKTKDFR